MSPLSAPYHYPRAHHRADRIAEGRLRHRLNLERRQLTPAEVQQHRSNAAKREAVRAALLAHPEKSDRAIAAEVRCTHPFVAKIREELSGNGFQSPETRQVERGGKTYTQDTSNIGKRKAPEPTPQPEVKPTLPAPVPAVADPAPLRTCSRTCSVGVGGASGPACSRSASAWRFSWRVA